MYIVGPNPPQTFNDTSFSVPKNNRMYFTTTDSMGPDNWYMPNLLGGSLEYDLDISQTGCSCDFAVYLTRMPWRDEQGTPTPHDDKTYYCDSNGINDKAYCPNFDIHESNPFNFMARAKSCSRPNRFEHYTACNETGQCTRTTYDQYQDQFSPKDDSTINTKQPFHVKVSFDLEANYVIELSQGENLLQLSSDDECKHDLSQLKFALAAGMNLVVSHWGSKNGDMQWLNSGSNCTGDCDGNPISTISNMAYTVGTGTVPPMPSPWSFGEDCASITDGDCHIEPVCTADSGEHCKWSWPYDDPARWNSKEAKCRCKGAENDGSKGESTQILQ